eukprot:6782959-Pyramimonas_sp.AAC.1
MTGQESRPLQSSAPGLQNRPSHPTISHSRSNASRGTQRICPCAQHACPLGSSGDSKIPSPGSSGSPLGRTGRIKMIFDMVEISSD